MSKVIFTDTRRTETIELPSYSGSQVVVYKDLNIGQQRALQNYNDNFERGIAAAQIAIKEWNLYQDENTLLPITQETLERFNEQDLLAIFTAITGKSAEELRNGGEVKKNTTPN